MVRRYPKISDTPDRFDHLGNKLCRNCMAEFNRNNSWFFVRKDVLRRDKYTCCICKQRMRKKFLDVDHIIPVQMGGQLFDKDNLRTLCKECHKSKTKLDRDALSDKI